MSAADAAGTLRREIAMADAADAARAGDLDGARRLLEPLGDDDPAVLDLRARVLAQSGDLDGADEAWRLVEAIAPGDPGAAAGRRAVERARRPGRRAVVGGTVVALALALALVLAAVVLLVPRTPTAPDPTSAGPAAPAAAPPAVGGGGPPVAVTPVLPPDPTAGAAAALAAPGVRARRTVDGVEVTFDRGLFARATELSDEGERTLVALGSRMAGRADEIEVTGRSVVVPGGPTAGGSPVAFARAARAAEVLARAAGMPLTAFTLRSTEQARLVGDDAARARTVSLLITTAG